MQRLRQRQIHGMKRGQFSKDCTKERFSGFELLGELDTHDPAYADFTISFLRRRAKVQEIVSAKSVIFALTQNGVCAAFHRDTMRRYCFLNARGDEVIRSLFYNRRCDSIITVSVYRSDDFTTLNCRSTSLTHIMRGDSSAGMHIFTTESLKWPGFVEFDDVNGKILTFSATDRTYKVWGLTNYNLLYTIPDDNIHEIKISPGVLLLIYNRAPSHVPLRIVSIEDGKPLASFSRMLHRNKKLDFIEQFNEKILIKQETENLIIVDIHTSEIVEVPQTMCIAPSAFIFLYENRCFLTLSNRNVDVWNFRGARIAVLAA